MKCVKGVNCTEVGGASLLHGYWNLRFLEYGLNRSKFEVKGVALPTNSTRFIHCPIEEACNKEQSIYEDYKCSGHYKQGSNLCNECKSMHAVKTNSNQCTDCTLHPWMDILVLLFKMLIYLGFTYKQYNDYSVTIDELKMATDPEL